MCAPGGGFADCNIALGLAERGLRDGVPIAARELAHEVGGRRGGFVLAGFSRGPAWPLRDLGPAAPAPHGGTVDAVKPIRARIRRQAITGLAPTTFTGRRPPQ